ncbi:MAG TPA: hypothetical protein VGN37_29970 [Actinocatenispora sp.]
MSEAKPDALNQHLRVEPYRSGDRYEVGDDAIFTRAADLAALVAKDIRDRVTTGFTDALEVAAMKAGAGHTHAPFGRFDEADRLVGRHGHLRATMADDLAALAADFDDIAKALRLSQQSYLETEDAAHRSFGRYDAHHQLSAAERRRLDAALGLDGEA